MSSTCSELAVKLRMEECFVYSNQKLTLCCPPPLLSFCLYLSPPLPQHQCFQGRLLYFPSAQKNQYWEAAWKTFHRSIRAQPGALISFLLRPLGTGLARFALAT